MGDALVAVVKSCLLAARVGCGMHGALYQVGGADASPLQVISIFRTRSLGGVAEPLQSTGRGVDKPRAGVLISDPLGVARDHASVGV